ncbi:MAG: DNA cytosine methyltransferase [Gordonia sp. (in: high G+C Gram-positive bacteria)]
MSVSNLASRHHATTATDLFAGGGGASIGLDQAGVRVAIAANHDPVAIATHKLNHPDTEHRQASVQDVDWRSFPSTDILWASPSCVWHTPAGGRRQPTLGMEMLRADSGAVDRATAFAVIAAAEVHLYPVVIVENVPEFADWRLYRWWLDGLRGLGYDITELLLDAADFGHAQHRRRLFIVAERGGAQMDLTPSRIDPVYAASILDPDPGRPVTRELYVSRQIAEISDADVPHLVTYRRNARARRADRHRLPTVTAGGNHHAVATIDAAGVAHHRMLSNRECARAQGFPDDYEFTGTRSQVKRQIGNAVAVGVARWLGERAVAALGGAG